jgi:pantoate--beta-alanine ligase
VKDPFFDTKEDFRMTTNKMKTITQLSQLRLARSKLPEPVGLVPTMGYLHAGHISLVERARQECASVVVSIFVNPTQFSPTEDLSSYPRDLEHDLKLLASAGTDLVWTPTPEEMYPEGYQTWVTLDELVKPLEGAMRPTHFKGVATVVSKLFNCVQPQKAYFGQKDAQQAAVIRRMSADLNFPVEVVICPIVRAEDGLALSSRNVYLNAEERKAATVLNRALMAAGAAYENGENNANTLRRIMTDIINGESLARLQYVSCADYDSLLELEVIHGKALLSMAVYFRNTRLIDNLVLG